MQRVETSYSLGSYKPGPVLLVRRSVFCCLLASVMIFMLVASAEAGIVDRLRAVVNGEVITQSDIDEQMAMRSISRSVPGDLSPSEVEQLVLDQLINQKLLDQDMRHNNPPAVSGQEIEQEIAGLRSLYSTQREFDTALQEKKFTMDRLRKLIEVRLQILKYIKERFTPQVTVTEDQIAEYYRNTFEPESRKSGATRIPPLEQVAPKIREILIERAINEKMDAFLSQRRRVANIVIS